MIPEVREEVTLSVETTLKVDALDGSAEIVPPPPPPSLLASTNGVKLPNTLEETSGEPLFPTFSEGVGAKGERLTRGVLLSDGELVSVLSPLRVWLDMAEDEPVPFPAPALELLIKGVREAKGEELSEGEEEEVFIPVVVSVEARENKEVGEGILGVAVESPPPRPPPPAEALERMEGVSREEAEEERDGMLVEL